MVLGRANSFPLFSGCRAFAQYGCVPVCQCTTKLSLRLMCQHWTCQSSHVKGFSGRRAARTQTSTGTKEIKEVMFFILARRLSAFLTCKHLEEMSSIQKRSLNYTGKDKLSKMKVINRYTVIQNTYLHRILMHRASKFCFLPFLFFLNKAHTHTAQLRKYVL